MFSERKKGHYTAQKRSIGARKFEDKELKTGAADQTQKSLFEKCRRESIPISKPKTGRLGYPHT